MQITFWDIKVGDLILVPGKAQNAYEVTSKSEKKICVRRKKDGLEHCMDTVRLLKEINGHLDINHHLLNRQN
jgi:hypothetical protein